MTITMTMNGQDYTAIPTEAYERMVERLGGELPVLPDRNERGRRPARQTGRIILAHKLIKRRIAAGWTQEELAQHAGVRVETISRLEAGKHKPRQATVMKIDDAFTNAGV